MYVYDKMVKGIYYVSQCNHGINQRFIHHITTKLCIVKLKTFMYHVKDILDFEVDKLKPKLKGIKMEKRGKHFNQIIIT